MGCGQTLFLGLGGHVTCSLIGCPSPDAVALILADPETEHLVDFSDHDFTILHPLRERLEEDQGGLWGCVIHRQIQALAGRPMPPGRYRVRQHPGYLGYEAVPR